MIRCAQRVAADGAEVIRAVRRYGLRNPRVENPAGHSEFSTIGRLYARMSGPALVAVLAPAA